MLVEKRRRKVSNARASVRKAKENGNSVGRKSIVDWKLARELRGDYMKMTKIAEYFGVSKSSISAGFKKRGIK